MVNLKNGFLPFGLVRLLPAQAAKTVIRDDLWSAKILELSRIGPGLFCQADQMFGAFQAAVMVSGDIRNEVTGVIIANCIRTNLDFHLLSPFVESFFAAGRTHAAQSSRPYTTQPTFCENDRILF